MEIQNSEGVNIQDMRDCITSILQMKEQLKEIGDKELKREEYLDNAIRQEYDEFKKGAFKMWAEEFEWTFNKEFTDLLKSLVPSATKVFRVKRFRKDNLGHYHSENLYYVTAKHGLKIPRSHFRYSVFRSDRISELFAPKFKKGKLQFFFSNGHSEILDYTELMSNKRVNSSKFSFFGDNLEKAYKILERVNVLEDESTEDFEKIKSIFSIWKSEANPEFKKLPDAIEELKDFRTNFILKYLKIQDDSRILLGELKEFNKPYRILLKLKTEKKSF